MALVTAEMARAGLKALRSVRADMVPISQFQVLSGTNRADLKYQPFFDPRKPQSAVEANVSWIAICVKKIADVAAGVPIRVGVRRKDEPDAPYDKVPPGITNRPNSPLNLLANPYGGLTWSAFSRFDTASTLLFGRVASQKIRLAGPTPIGQEPAPGNLVVGLRPLPFRYMDWELDVATGKLRKWIFQRNGLRQEFNPADVWFRSVGANVDDPAFGRSVLEDCSIAADLNWFIHASRSNFFRNGARLGGVIKTELDWDELDPETPEPDPDDDDATPVQSASMIDRFYQTLQRHHGGLGNFYLPLVLGDGMDYVNPDISAKDLDFSQGSKDARDECLAAFGVPITELGIHDGGDQHVSLENRITFETHVVLPLVKDFCASLAQNVMSEWDLPPGFEFVCYPGAGWQTVNPAAIREDMIAELGGNGTRITVATAAEWRLKRGYTADIADPDGMTETLLIDQGTFAIDDPNRNAPPSLGGPVAAAVNPRRLLAAGAPGRLEAAARRVASSSWRTIQKTAEREIRGGYVKALSPQEAKVVAAVRSRFKGTDIERGFMRSLFPAREKEARRMAEFLTAPKVAAMAKTSRLMVRSLGVKAAEPTIEMIEREEVLEYVEAQSFDFLLDFNDSSVEDLQKIYADIVREGGDLNDLVGKIHEYYGDSAGEWRAWRDARTASTGAMGWTAVKVGAESGTDAKKSWAATHDDRTRDSHLVADGEYQAGIPLDAAFDVGGSEMQYPGDPAGDGEEVFGCRCGIVYVQRGDR